MYVYPVWSTEIHGVCGRVHVISRLSQQSRQTDPADVRQAEKSSWIAQLAPPALPLCLRGTPRTMPEAAKKQDQDVTSRSTQ